MKHNKDSNAEQQILEAAETLFLEKGFALTSTTEIAKVAGCNQALVHYYFRTKEKLFEAIFEKKAHLFFSVIFQDENTDKSFEQRLQETIEAHFDIVAANSKIPFLFINELTTNQQRLITLSGEFVSVREVAFRKIEQELQAEIKKGTIRPMKLIDLLITVISLNLTLFLVKPIIKVITNISDEDFQKLIAHRKEENVKIILNSLKP